MKYVLTTQAQYFPPLKKSLQIRKNSFSLHVTKHPKRPFPDFPTVFLPFSILIASNTPPFPFKTAPLLSQTLFSGPASLLLFPYRSHDAQRERKAAVLLLARLQQLSALDKKVEEEDPGS